MKKPNKNKALDGLAAKLRSVLGRETTNIVEIGDILIESRKLLADEHGQWMPWLAENFDMSYRSAINYCKAAEYVASKIKCATVANLANVAPTVLYALATGYYDAEEEAAILAATHQGRVDQTRANDICEDLCEDLPVKTFEEINAAAAAEAATAAAAEDAEVEAILDGPPPLPPPEVSASPDYALQQFDQAITALMQVMTKPPARFAGTVHTANDLEHVLDFIRAVADRAREVRIAGPDVQHNQTEEDSQPKLTELLTPFTEATMSKTVSSRILSGYDVDEMGDGSCTISKDGKTVCTQPSLDAVRRWVMEQRRKSQGVSWT